MHIYVYIYGILSICCCVSSLSYRYPLHISAWLQANAIMQELPLQYEHCSHRPEKILSPTTTGESSHHYICTAVAAGCRISTAATTTSTTHSHCLGQQVPILRQQTSISYQCSAYTVNSIWDRVLQSLRFLCNAASSLTFAAVWQHRVSPRICATL